MVDQTTPVTVTTSKRFRLNAPDWAKALLMAVLTPVVGCLYEVSTSSTPFIFDWKKIGALAFAGGMSYLVKNFFSSSQTIIK